MRTAQTAELPGRLNLLKMSTAWISLHTTGNMVVFLLEIGETGVTCSYYIKTRSWFVDLDGIRFEVAHNPNDGLIAEIDAVMAVRKLLCCNGYVEAKQITALKRWRQILQVYPAKVLTLKK